MLMIISRLYYAVCVCVTCVKIALQQLSATDSRYIYILFRS